MFPDTDTAIHIYHGLAVNKIEGHYFKFGWKLNYNPSEKFDGVSYHKKNEDLCEKINMLKIEGNDKFSIIKNIPDVEIKEGKKMITFLTEELIQLLYK